MVDPFARARTRFLAALGIPLSSLAVACHGSAGQSPPLAQADVTAPSTTTAQAAQGAQTAQAAQGAQTAQTAQGARTAQTAQGARTAQTAQGAQTAPPVPVEAQQAPMKRLPFPRCPSGVFCVPPSRAGDAGQADPPYEACAKMADMPGDAGPVAWRHPHAIGFSPEGTAEHRDAGEGQVCCYNWVVPCPGGRPLRVAGKPVVARAVRAPGRSRRGDAVRIDVSPLDGRARAALARVWTREAELEHASIAAFEEVARELTALGAPESLVLAARSAAADEARHARTTFGFASAFAGRGIGPGSLPRRARAAGRRDVVALAVETLVDGCAGETVASLHLREAAARARCPEMQRALARMADDEERHAELGWRILAWALAAGGERARREVSVAAGGILAGARARDGAAAHDGGGVAAHEGGGSAAHEGGGAATHDGGGVAAHGGGGVAVHEGGGVAASGRRRGVPPGYGVLSDEEGVALRSRALGEVFAPCVAALC